MVSNGSAGNQRRIRQSLNPVAEGMPLVELMVPSALVDVGQYLIVEHDCSPLVVRGGEELDHLPPVFLVFGFEVFLTTNIQTSDSLVEMLHRSTRIDDCRIYFFFSPIGK